MYGTELHGVDVVRVTDDDLKQLMDSHQATTEMRAAHPLMLLVPKVDLHFSIDERAIEVEPSVFCVSPQWVEIILGLSGYVAYMEETAYDDECVRRELLRHAELHAKAENEAMSLLIKSLNGPLHDRLTSLKSSSATDAKSAIERFKSGLGEFLLNAVKGFGGDRLKMQAEIDTPQVLSYLRGSCNGRVQRLEKIARSPIQGTI
jgi:hypothetical protein